MVFLPFGVLVNSLLPHKEAAGWALLALWGCAGSAAWLVSVEGLWCPSAAMGWRKLPQKKRLSGMCGSVGGTEEGRLEQPLMFEFWD